MYKFITVLLFLGLIFTPWSHTQPEKDFDQIVTDDAFLYIDYNSTAAPDIEYPNFNAAIKKWTKTLDDILEWRILTQEWQAIQEELGLKEGFPSLGGERWTLAMFGFGEGMAQLPSLLYLTHVDDPIQAADVLNRAFEGVADLNVPLSQDQDTYKDYTIRTLYGPGMIPGLCLAYSLSDDLLMISTSKPKLMEILDTYDLDENKIGDNPVYQETLAKLPKEGHCKVFWNFTDLPEIADGILNSLKAMQMLSKDEEMAKGLNIAEKILPYVVKTVKAIGTNYHTTSEGNNQKTTYTLFYSEVEESIIAPLLKNEPVDLLFENYLPRRTGSFVAANIGSLHDIWKVFQNIANQFPLEQNPMIHISAFEAQYGVSIAGDLLSWIGEQSCFVRMIMDLNAIVPTNRMAFIVNVKDMEQAKVSLDKIQNLITNKLQLPVTPEKEIYRSNEINTYRLPIPILPLSPSWCLDEGKFILATDVSLVREMLDIKAGTTSGIERNRYYRRLQGITQEKANVITFQDIESELYTYREALRRVSSISELGKEIGDQEQMLPFILMDRAAYLLTCLQIYKAATQRAVIDVGKAVSEKETIVQDLQAVPSTDALLRYKISLGTKDWLGYIAGWFARRGDTERAIRMYNTLIDFYPGRVDYIQKAAELYSQQENKEKALEMFNKVLESNPSTELLIEREKFRSPADPETIIESVKKEAEWTERIKEEAALFGIAMNQRKEGNEETALALLKSLVDRFPASKFATPASKEVKILQGEEPEGLITLPKAKELPKIDGDPDDPAWEDATDEIPLLITPAHAECSASVQFMQNESNLYILITGTDSFENGDIEEEEFVLRACPQRDYVHLVKFTMDVEEEEGEQIIQSSIVEKYPYDPWGLDSSGTNEHESFKTEWPASMQKIEDKWCMEMAIPFTLINNKDLSPNDIWLLNMSRSLKTGGKKINQSLTEIEKGVLNFKYVTNE